MTVRPKSKPPRTERCEAARLRLSVGSEPEAHAPGEGAADDVVHFVVRRVDAVGQEGGAHVQGKAELVDVVTSVASAEASLETAMAVRDQVISAYQQIMQMPI